jgi:prevent-host-death family protein
MDEVVSVTEVHRKLFQLLQNVRRGRSYIVTSHAKPIAKISPVFEVGKIQGSARANLLSRLRKQSVTKAVRWTRDELY